MPHLVSRPVRISPPSQVRISMSQSPQQPCTPVEISKTDIIFSPSNWQLEGSRRYLQKHSVSCPDPPQDLPRHFQRMYYGIIYFVGESGYLSNGLWFYRTIPGEICRTKLLQNAILIAEETFSAASWEWTLIRKGRPVRYWNRTYANPFLAALETAKRLVGGVAKGMNIGIGTEDWKADFPDVAPRQRWRGQTLDELGQQITRWISRPPEPSSLFTQAQMDLSLIWKRNTRRLSISKGSQALQGSLPAHNCDEEEKKANRVLTPDQPTKDFCLAFRGKIRWKGSIKAERRFRKLLELFLQHPNRSYHFSEVSQHLSKTYTHEERTIHNYISDLNKLLRQISFPWGLCVKAGLVMVDHTGP